MCCMQEAPPNSLHEDRQPRDESPSQIVLQAEESTSSLSCCVNTEEGGTTSMIVPVWLSSSNSESETLVYALLDTQSSHTFVVPEVCESLQALIMSLCFSVSATGLTSRGN